MSKLVLSLTTYPARFEYLTKAVQSILNQTMYQHVDVFYINIDDNLTDEQYAKYDEFIKIDNKIKIKRCPAKWRSANKLLWVYKEHHDDIIVCFDDDKCYPPKCLEQLVFEWSNNKDCIISQEINPIIIENNKVFFVNSYDLKLKQREFGKYLSNACLFCPNCFDEDVLFDYDKFIDVTNGCHDELWFWICSTLKGIQSIGLNFTFSYGEDDGVTFPLDDSSLSFINSEQKNIDDYNNKVNEVFGERLLKILVDVPIIFNVTVDNILAITGHIIEIAQLYSKQKILFKYDSESFPKSWLTHLMLVIREANINTTNIFFTNGK